MKKGFIYISILAAAVLASCVKNPVGERTLSGTGEKTPIVVVSNVNANTSVTKAVDGRWEANDIMFAYVQHVKEATPATDPKTYNVVDVAGTEPRIQYFKVGALTDGHHNVANNFDNENASLLTPVNADGTAVGFYWDDFSVGGKGDENDIRTSGHYLQSFYGYCFNGGAPDSGKGLDTDDKKAAGVIGWTVSNAQDAVPTSPAVSNFQKSDLLWSGEQTPVAYSHDKNRDGLQLPFTHAMSKVTIEIVLNDGFDTNADGSAKAFGTNSTSRVATTPTIFANRVTQVTAPTLSLSTTVASEEDSKIQMYLSDDEATNKKHRVYEAIIAPTVFKNEQKLAEVTVDGNKYDINLTNVLLTTVSEGTAWSSQLKEYTIDGSTLTQNSSGDYTTAKGGITLPGVNYRIKVTLNKQKIDVVAYITNWTDVNASVDGTIMFDSNVVSDTATGTEVTSTSFDLWRSTTNDDAVSYDADNTVDGIQKATTCEYNSTESKWEGSPKIYWANGSTSYYFRALAQVANPSSAPNVITSVSGSQAAAQGIDLLWAQTAEHKGKDASGNIIKENGVDKVYPAGGAINPRTGSVPMAFEHAMSKLSLKLTTTEGDDAVDLANAKISIINLYDGGTVNIKTGNIESLTSPLDSEPAGDPFTIKDVTVDASHQLLNQIVIPQSLVKDKNDGDRDTKADFYQKTDLTLIYPGSNATFTGTENTSIGTGVPAYYVTTTLDPVDFTDETAALYNSNLPGAVSTETEKTPAVLYTYEEYIAIEGNEGVSRDAFDALSDEEKTKTHAENYSSEEARAYNAALPGAVTAGTFHYYKTNESSKAANPGDLKNVGNKIMMYITLADNTRYVIDLASCKDSGDNVIEKWKRGKHYTYTISLAKEQITFRAMIKDWVEKTGSGNANLEWD